MSLPGLETRVCMNTRVDAFTLLLQHPAPWHPLEHTLHTASQPRAVTSAQMKTLRHSTAESLIELQDSANGSATFKAVCEQSPEAQPPSCQSTCTEGLPPWTWRHAHMSRAESPSTGPKKAVYRSQMTAVALGLQTSLQSSWQAGEPPPSCSQGRQGQAQVAHRT